jgi:hypothetical protein
MSDDTLRRLRSSIAANERWSRVADRSAATAPGRAAFMARFERQVDPDNKLSPDERAKRAQNAMKAYFSSLALKSAKARAKVTDGVREAAEVEAAIADIV